MELDAATPNTVVLSEADAILGLGTACTDVIRQGLSVMAT